MCYISFVLYYFMSSLFKLLFKHFILTVCKGVGGFYFIACAGSGVGGTPLCTLSLHVPPKCRVLPMSVLWGGCLEDGLTRPPTPPPFPAVIQGAWTYFRFYKGKKVNLRKIPFLRTKYGFQTGQRCPLYLLFSCLFVFCYCLVTSMFWY